MPITVTCDECLETHRVKDEAVGKLLKCKGCGRSLMIVAPPPPEDDFGNLDETDFGDDEADDGDDRRASPKRKALPKKTVKGKSGKSKPVPIHRTKVPLGVDCVFFGFVLTCLAVLIASSVSWSMKGDPKRVAQIVYLLSLGSIAATIITSIGKLLCLTAPSNMSGRGSIFVAVAIDLLSLSITVGSLVTVVPGVLRGAVHLVSLAGLVCFILFLQNLGDFLGERDLRERGYGVFKMGIGFVVLWLSMIGLGVLALANKLPLFVAGLGISLVSLVWMVTGIIFVIRYGGLLLTCRYALSNC